MDKIEIGLTSKFMKGIVSKLISKFLLNRFGYNVGVQIDDLEIKLIDGGATIRTNVEVKLGNDELKEMLRSITE